jgi:hypothetical protein
MCIYFFIILERDNNHASVAGTYQTGFPSVHGSVVCIYAYFKGPAATVLLDCFVLYNTSCHGKLSSAAHNAPLA